MGCSDAVKEGEQGYGTAARPYCPNLGLVLRTLCVANQGGGLARHLRLARLWSLLA